MKLRSLPFIASCVMFLYQIQLGRSDTVSGDTDRLEDIDKEEGIVPPQTEPSDDYSEKSFGSNNVGLFNQSCVSPTIICAADRNLNCDPTTLTCQCHLDSFTQHRMVYSPQTERCHDIPTKEKTWTCQTHEQCQASRYGRYSLCEDQHCECMTQWEGHAVVKNDSICYLFKAIGDTCTSSEECDVSISGDAICHGIGKTHVELGICRCADGFQSFDGSKACLPIGSYNSECEFDGQCNDPKALGSLARCSEVKKRCECWDTEKHGSRVTGYFKGKCYLSKKKWEECEFVQECQTGYHYDAICVEHESYNGAKVCQCPEMKWCGENAANRIVLSASFLIVVLAKVYLG